MKRLSLHLMTLIAAAILLTGCGLDEICERGLGTRVTETIALPEFTGIDLSISGDVYLTQGDEQKVEVRGQENIIDLLDLDVENGVWTIRFVECVRKVSDFDIYITIPKLTSAHLSGSGNIEGETPFTVEDLDLQVSGSGNISLEATGNNITSKISGSGNIHLALDAVSLINNTTGSGNYSLTGKVTTHDFDVKGSGDVMGFELITDDTKINIAGSGKAEVYADKNLDINISGSGNVSYKGFPTLDVNISGSGEVINAN